MLSVCLTLLGEWNRTPLEQSNLGWKHPPKSKGSTHSYGKVSWEQKATRTWAALSGWQEAIFTLFTLCSSSPATHIAPGSSSSFDYIRLPPWLLNQHISFVLEANIERKLPMGQVQFSKPTHKSWDLSGWLLLESLQGRRDLSHV